MRPARPVVAGLILLSATLQGQVIATEVLLNCTIPTMHQLSAIVSTSTTDLHVNVSAAYFAESGPTDLLIPFRGVPGANSLPVVVTPPSMPPIVPPAAPPPMLPPPPASPPIPNCQSRYWRLNVIYGGTYQSGASNHICFGGYGSYGFDFLNDGTVVDPAGNPKVTCVSCASSYGGNTGGTIDSSFGGSAGNGHWCTWSDTNWNQAGTDVPAADGQGPFVVLDFGSVRCCESMLTCGAFHFASLPAPSICACAHLLSYARAAAHRK